MGSQNSIGVSAHDSDPNIEEILAQFDPYIVARVQKMVLLSSNIAQPDVLDLEIDEIAQRVRIKFWKALQCRPIEHPKAYIRAIVSNEFHDIPRKRRPPMSLPTDEEGEIYMGDVMVTQSEGMSDPAYEFDREEGLANWMALTADVVSTLSPRQRSAMICLLKERVDDHIQLVEAFVSHKIDVESFNWPDDEVDAMRLKASISAARRNIAQRMGVNLVDYKKKGTSDLRFPMYSDEEMAVQSKKS